ncbi:TetR/AcrR family transcriptional regulator [Halalkalibacterium halodurans]|uniref:Transcriptional regulator (TetR family) n=2 Tax=Halalkalibacterium halodurans TaxID=86665 RepID=Q9KE56_HALH5|nr:TetR/AcrR family transcriptional regulator [Halalkalibacterium halodurans]MDY7221539.1 TetR/AcrR family transcriptional regulator [Halalkalibacterium halodurans]MDY7240815.1 TetR/AcrR family transcriptional regulator [Halalkalibacterium halodurans]MED4080470.1 TetR/AcrR family transcriptional regulator [Halalkalibacterium halodurans]MED4086517.1 TetR/AcrR family transcriptional regulator [Halalkalibacterium halodurans]MED4104774.1 TetR/AcrR family transcriptional regulator [Halalkalibacteri
MDGFQRRKEQKKRDILEAALSLFMEYGLQKVSIAEIAKNANVSQVTIYNYFESKHNLTHEVFLYYMDKAVRDFEQTVYSDKPFPEKIKEIMFRKKEVARRIHEEFYQYLMKEYTANETIAENDYMQNALQHFDHLFQEGKEQGYVDPSLSHEAIIFYIKMLNEYIQKEEVYEKILPLTEDITKLFFYGIMGEKKHRKHTPE